MTRRRIAAIALTLSLVLAAPGELWIHEAFGTNTPWDTPEFVQVCGRRYDLGGIPGDPATIYTLYAQATVFDMPIPMPEVSPIPGEPNWGGCPLQVVLKRKAGDLVYGHIQGGP